MATRRAGLRARYLLSQPKRALLLGALVAVVAGGNISFRESTPEGQWSRTGSGWSGHVLSLSVMRDASELSVSAGGAGRLTLGPTEVRRGRHVTALSGTPFIDARGVVLTTDGVTEVVGVRHGGFEQSWLFDSAPAGEGDLQVRLPVRSGTFVASGPGGLLFDTASGRIEYGHATWVDASGRRTGVQAEFSDDSVSISVPEAVLARSQFPAVLDPLISAVFSVGSTQYVPAQGDQGSPDIASSAGRAYVAWQESGAPAAADTSLLISVLLEDGGLVSPTGRVMAAGQTSIFGLNPRVAANADAVLVVWETSSGVAATVLNRDGSVRRAPFYIGPGTTWETEASVATNGQGFMIIWRRNTPGGTLIHTTPVSNQGVVSLAGTIASGSAVGPAIASGGLEYLASWVETSVDTGDVYTRRVDSAGNAQGMAQPVATGPGRQSGQSIAFSQGLYLVVWNGDSTAPGPSSALIDAANTSVVQRSGPYVATPTGPIRVTTTSSGFLIAWAQTSGPQAVLTDGTGAPLGPVVSLGAAVPFSSLSSRDGGFMLASAWIDPMSNSSKDIYLQSLDSALSEVGAPLLLSKTVQSQTSPAVLANGETFLAAWVDRMSTGANDIVLDSLDKEGHSLTDGGILVVAGLQPRYSLKLTRGPRLALLTWGEDGGVHGTRISDGGVLDPGGFVIVARGSPSLSAWCGGSFLVLSSEGFASSAQLSATRVDAAGLRIDAQPRLLLSGSFAGGLATDGTTCLLVWRDFVTGHIRGSRIDGNATLLDQPPLAIQPASSYSFPTVGVLQSHFVVVWSNALPPSTQPTAHRLLARRITSAGVFLETNPIALGDGPYPFPYALNGESTPYLVWGGANESRLSRLDLTRGLLDPSGLLVGRNDALYRASCDALSDSTVLSLAAEADARDGYREVRIVGRTVTLNRAPILAVSDASVAEDTTLTLGPLGADPDGDELTLSITSQGLHGTASVSLARYVAYSPHADYVGPDQIEVLVSDGFRTAQARIDILVTPVNDAPVAQPRFLTLDAGTTIAFTLGATDIDSASLTYRVTRPPLSGTLAGTPPDLRYTAPAEAGFDWIEFEADDGMARSAAVRISFDVLGPARPRDAGASSVGSPSGADAGAAVEPSPRNPGGCGCGVADATSLLGFVVAGLLLWRRSVG